MTSTTTTIGVLIADDKASFLRAARAVVEEMPGYVVVAEATSGEQAVLEAERLRPRLALIDVNMPGMGGVAAAVRIRRAVPTAVVVLVSTYDPADLPGEVRTAGVGYLDKARLDPDTLAAAYEAGRNSPPEH